MKTDKVALTRFLGLTRPESQEGFHLPYSDNCMNHVGTVHAGAQFILAEVASGDYLRTLFPDLADKVYPVVRRAEIKYRSAAKGELFARVSVSEDEVELFHDRLRRKGRALIHVHVDVVDVNSVSTARGDFEWYVEMLPGVEGL